MTQRVAGSLLFHKVQPAAELAASLMDTGCFLISKRLILFQLQLKFLGNNTEAGILVV